MKPANIAVLSKPETKEAFSVEVGERIAAWGAEHPEATLEERAAGWRSIPMAGGLNWLVYTSPSPRDRTRTRMPCSA